MIAVVTGARGFVGSHLVETLRARGDTVRVVHRAGAGPVPSAATVLDLHDAAGVAHSPVWDGADVVFHVGAATRGTSEAALHRANAIPTAHIAAALAARGAGAPRLVLVSSQAAGGPAVGPDRPRTEEDPDAPVEAYGRSKLAAEQVVRGYGDAVRAVIVRPCTVYGPRDRDVTRALRQAVRPVSVYVASPDQVVSLVHVRDLVAALLLAAERPQAVGGRYYVAGGAVTWRALYAAAAAAVGRRPGVPLPLPRWGLAAVATAVDAFWPAWAPPPLVTRHKVALTAPRWWVCDASRARRELGWEASIGLEDGLRDCLGGGAPLPGAAAGGDIPRDADAPS